MTIKFKAAPAHVTDQVTATPANVAELVTAAAASGSAQAQKFLEEGTVQAQAAMEQAQKAATDFSKTAGEAAEFGRGNVEAFTKAAQLYFAGMQDLSRQYMTNVQGMSEHAMESAKAFSGAKSLKDVADVQAVLARTAFEKTMADATKLQEAVVKLTEEALAPITARMTLAAEKLARPIAA